MNKSIYAIAIALVLGTTGALATPGGEGNNTGCNGVGNPNSPCEGQGGNGGNGGNGGSGGSGGAGGSSEVTNEITNTNTANAAASAGAVSNSSTVINLGDTPISVSMDGPTGQSAGGSSSSAQGGDGGDSTAHAAGGAGGDSSSVASVGDSTSQSGDSVSKANSGGNKQALTIVDDSVYTYQYNYEDSAASAASVYSQVCMNGGSGQTRAAGFSVNNQDVVCEHLKIASVMREAFIFEIQYGDKSDCFVDRGGMTNCKVSEKAVEYNKAYHEHLTEAIQAMEAYEEVGLMDKMAGALIRPMALIGALIWLI